MKELIIAFIITFSIMGCVTVEKRGDTIVIDPWTKTEEKIESFLKKLKRETTEKRSGAREEALKKYGLEGLREMLIVERSLITPEVVKSGNKVKQEVKFVLLAPEEEKLFNLTETILLSNSKETFELKKRSSEKSQGIHLSTIEFTIPSDLEPGEYTITTILDIGRQKKSVKGSFKLEEK